MKNISFAFKSLLKQGFTYGLGEAINKSIYILLIPLYVRYLSPSEFGQYCLLLITANIIIMIFSANLGSSLLRSYYDYKFDNDRNDLITTAFLITSGLSISLIIFGYLFSGIISKLILTTEKSHFLFIMLLAGAFQVMNQIPLNVLRAKMQAKKFIISNISLTLLHIILVIFFLVFLNMKVSGLVFSFLIYSILSFLLFYALIFKNIWSNFNPSEFYKLFAFGLPLIPSGIAIFIMNSSGSFFLKYFTSLSQVGIYNIAYKFGMITQFLLVLPLAKTWNPIMLAVKDKPFANKFYSKTLTYYVFAGILVLLSISIIAKELLIVFTNEQYVVGYKIVPLILLSYFFVGFGRVSSGVGINLKRKTKYDMYSFVIASILNLFLNYLLIPKFGIMGAAVATCLAYLCAVTLKFFYSRKLYRINYEFNRVFLILFTGFIIFFFGRLIDTGNLWFNIAIKLNLLIIYPLALYFIDPETRKEIQALIKKYIMKVRES